MVKPHVDPAIRSVLVERLRRQRADGRLTSADVRATAVALVVSERTVWRWVTGEDEQSGRVPRARYELTEADRDGYADWRGNIAALQGGDGRGGATIADVAAGIRPRADPGERAAVVDGVEGRRRHEVYLRWEPVARNVRWEADHKELPVQVSPPRGARPVKPWPTLFVDCYSRLIMGWALSLSPNAATVLAALRRGLVVDPERARSAGYPGAGPGQRAGVRDHRVGPGARCWGSSWTRPMPMPAPEGKGRARQLDRGPGVPVRVAVRHRRPARCGRAAVRARCAADGAGAVRRPLRRVGDRLRHRTGHSALDGQTPLQRWNADATPVREVPEAELRWLLLADKERTINRDGIHFENRVFIAPEFNGLVGEPVQVR